MPKTIYTTYVNNGSPLFGVYSAVGFVTDPGMNFMSGEVFPEANEACVMYRANRLPPVCRWKDGVEDPVEGESLDDALRALVKS